MSKEPNSFAPLSVPTIAKFAPFDHSVCLGELHSTWTPKPKQAAKLRADLLIVQRPHSMKKTLRKLSIKAHLAFLKEDNPLFAALLWILPLIYHHNQGKPWFAIEQACEPHLHIEQLQASDTV